MKLTIIIKKNYSGASGEGGEGGADGAHLRISVLHYLMNLKNSYLLKNDQQKMQDFKYLQCFFFKKHVKISLFYTCSPNNFKI